MENEEVIIQVTIQYPAYDGTHEIAKRTVTLKTGDIDKAKVDMVFMKTAEAAQLVLNRYRARKWIESDHQRSAQATAENPEG